MRRNGFTLPESRLRWDIRNKILDCKVDETQVAQGSCVQVQGAGALSSLAQWKVPLPMELELYDL